MEEEEEEKLKRRKDILVYYACSVVGCLRVSKPYSREKGWLIGECIRTRDSKNYQIGDIIIRCPEHVSTHALYMVGLVNQPPTKWSPVQAFKRRMRRQRKKDGT